MLTLNFLSLVVILFALIFLNFSVLIQVLIFLGFLVIILIKKYNYWYFVLILITLLSWNIRLEEKSLEKESYYKMKLMKVGNKGRVLKVNDKLFSENAYINLTYIDIQDGVYTFELIVNSVKEYNTIKYIDAEFINFKNHWSNKFRNYLRNNIENISKSRDIIAFLRSVILAENSDLSEEFKEKFNYLGISHVIVISGLHLGILLFGILQVFRWVGLGYYSKHILTLLVLTIYSAMLGFTPSVQRAYIMASLYILSKLFFEKKDVKKSFHLALLLSIVYNPYLIKNVGFQMSYIAVFAIIYVYPLLEEKLSNKIIQYAILSIVIQLLLMPIFLYNLKMLYLLSFVANLIIVPISALLINFSFLAVLISFINIDVINKMLGEILNVLYRSLNGFVVLLSNIPFMQLSVKQEVSFFLFIWLYLGIVIFYLYLRKLSVTEASLKK